MPNPENLIGKGFDAHPENINRNGREPGSKNKSTNLRRYSDLIYKDKEGKQKAQPFGAEDQKPMTVEEIADLALIRKVISGDVSAYKEYKDILYGKNPDIITGDPANPLHVSTTNQQMPPMTEEQLNAEMKRRGLPYRKLEE